ncbi:hypothetical protein BDP55DRAFT_653267 [Colletotrichum godetiae]|uniref:Uncharacterized protein n=1 Tax=Colletotrichum godetiae TaxID=1209918 RepID=A0AAJ0ATQ8_9PEZI|nr:uncharacterized protein BDP55DRAFT_653267 [Colletotrichum godetiae]KAK1689477.1 hypothetical protein BDP55DRAFT_653267 [Colletotrichum godetiae]
MHPKLFLSALLGLLVAPSAGLPVQPDETLSTLGPSADLPSQPDDKLTTVSPIDVVDNIPHVAALRNYGYCALQCTPELFMLLTVVDCINDCMGERGYAE